MNIVKRLSGNVVKGSGKVVGFTLDVVIGILDVIVSIVRGVGRGILGILGAGGCLILMILGPFGFALLLNPVTLLALASFIIIPFLGTKSISYLKYIKYASTEYLFDRAEHLIEGKKNEFKSLNEYGNKYKRMEEEKRRREQEQRQQEQQRQWEERFKQWNQYQSSQRSGGYDFGNSYSGGYQQVYTNPTTEFKKKYEDSMDLLGLGYNTDFYEVKLAYRKKAKQYHPDVNNSPDATKMFQKINDAYEFLSEGNIERYKSIN